MVTKPFCLLLVFLFLLPNQRCVGPGTSILRGNLVNMSVRASLGCELALVLVLLFDAWIKGKGIGFFVLITDGWPFCRVVLAAVSGVDVIVDLVLVNSGKPPTFRLSPLLRSGLLVTTLPSARETFIAVYRALPGILNILLLGMLWIFSFAWMGFVLFGSPADPYFSTIGTSVSSLQILLTTANFPDIMMPAYSRSRFAYIFFFVFIIGGIPKQR